MNKFLAIFGLKIVEVCIGRWSGNPPRRTVYSVGWRLARRGERDGMTELDRFVISHKEDIEARRRK